MPGPGIYVVAVVVGVAAGIAFKEFVYDPHLAPKIEQWADALTTYRIERRRRRNPSHSYSHLDSDNGDTTGSSFPTKGGLQPDSPVETEMHMLGRETTLRQRKLSVQEVNSLEMIERPNPLLPFVPLSPSPLLPPSASTSNLENVTMPIARLPGSQGEPRPSSRVSASSARSAGGDPSLSTPTPLVHSASRVTPSMSEHGFALTASRGTSPFTSANVSRAGTPWSDVRSASSIDVRSGTSFTDNPSEMSFVSEMNHPQLNLNQSLLHSTTFSQVSLSNQSEISIEHSESSLDTSFSSSVQTRSDASLDFLESDGDQRADLVDMLSQGSAPGILSDEEWENLSAAERSTRL